MIEYVHKPRKGALTMEILRVENLCKIFGSGENEITVVVLW